MSTATLTAPKRRDVKALTAVVADIKPKDHVVALLRDDRYGLYQVVGKVAASCAHDGLVLAGVGLSSSNRPNTALVGLDPLAASTAFASGGADADLDSLAHGDFITAWFSTDAWGSFTISGHLVALGSSGALMLGGWFVRSNGKPGKHLNGGIVLDPALATEPPPPRADIRIEAA